MAKLNKPCPVNAADVEFLVGKDYNNNVVDVPISSLPDFPEVDVECALQNSPTIRDLKAEDAKLLQLYLALKSRLDDFRILPIHLKNSIEALEELNLCNVRLTLCDVEWDTVFHGKVTTEDVLTSPEIVTDNLTVNDTAIINDEEVANSHITTLASDDATIERLTVNESIDDKGTLNVEWQTTTKGIANEGDIDNVGNITNEGKISNTGDIENEGNISNKGNVTNEWDINNTGNINNDWDFSNTGEVATDSLVSQTGTIGDLTSDRVVVTTTLESIGETITRGIDNTGDITNSGKITTDGIETNTAKVNTKLESLGETITNGIENTGAIETETLTVVGDAEFGGKTTMKELEVTDELVSLGNTTTNGIVNDGNITSTGNIVNDWNIVNHGDITTDGNLTVDWVTDIQQLEVNKEANFREPVNVYDDFCVSGDYILNGEGKFNGPETHNGDITYNGDVVFNGKLTADDIDIDLSDYQEKADKGRVNGYASLDDQGKVPMSQLPNIAGGINYKGGWNAWTGVYPSNPSNGDMYYCTNGGTVNGTVYNRWDRIIYDSDTASWNVLPDNYGVQSVNGRTGIVVDVQDTTDRKDTIDLVTPATNKYLSEKAVADLVNPLIQRIEELEEENAKTQITSLDSGSGLPASMTEWVEYTVNITGMTADTHVIVLDTITNGNIVLTPGNGFVKVISSANETNPVINILAIKPNN